MKILVIYGYANLWTVKNLYRFIFDILLTDNVQNSQQIIEFRILHLHILHGSVIYF